MCCGILLCSAGRSSSCELRKKAPDGAHIKLSCFISHMSLDGLPLEIVCNIVEMVCELPEVNIYSYVEEQGCFCQSSCFGPFRGIASEGCYLVSDVRANASFEERVVDNVQTVEELDDSGVFNESIGTYLLTDVQGDEGNVNVSIDNYWLRDMNKYCNLDYERHYPFHRLGERRDATLKMRWGVSKRLNVVIRRCTHYKLQEMITGVCDPDMPAISQLYEVHCSATKLDTVLWRT